MLLDNVESYQVPAVVCHMNINFYSYLHSVNFWWCRNSVYSWVAVESMQCVTISMRYSWIQAIHSHTTMQQISISSIGSLCRQVVLLWIGFRLVVYQCFYWQLCRIVVKPDYQLDLVIDGAVWYMLQLGLCILYANFTFLFRFFMCQLSVCRVSTLIMFFIYFLSIIYWQWCQ